MELYPAIDLRGGRCVRLLRGDYDAETVYGDDPAAVAAGFVAAGARWIHCVDLDAARTGEATNRDAVAAIAAVATAAGVSVQCGGGVRSIEAATALWDVGVTRVVVGTAAVEDPGLVGRLAASGGGQVALGLDVRGRDVAVRGWEQGSGRDLFDVLAEVGPHHLGAVVVTQISRDGTLEGPDLEGLAEVLTSTDVSVIASGGVGRPSDLTELAALVGPDGRGLAGAIVGKAIYEGHVDVAAAVAALDAAGGR